MTLDPHSIAFRTRLAQAQALRADDRSDFLLAEQTGNLVAVRFTTTWHPYAPGEVAHVAPSLAARIVPEFGELA